MAFRDYSRSTWIALIAGTVLIVAGVLWIAFATHERDYVSGGIQIAGGIVALLRAATGFSYKAFVAWRYLLIENQKVTVATKRTLAVALVVYASLAAVAGRPIGFSPSGMRAGDPFEIAGGLVHAFFAVVLFWGVLRHSKPALILYLGGIAVSIVGALVFVLAGRGLIPFVSKQDHVELIMQISNVVAISGAILTALAALFGTLRAFFTFFSTVPIGGVWIGTSALIVVLAVMSGFETDLRDKILGSSAHIQITREDGDFVDWRDVKAKLDRVPGVVASTPYALSEVVLAANSNSINVVIKGIDPETIGAVTDLVADLEEQDKDALERLAPLVKEPHDRTVVPGPKRGEGVMDPAPDDLPSPDAPIDFSKPAPSSSSTRHDRDPYGGDAADVVDDRDDRDDRDVVDPSPPDLVASAGPPIDYSQPEAPREGSITGAIIDPPTEVLDMTFEPLLSERAQALPGILVGRELIKQTHLFRGEEVRVVSPLSDPSNPDATGTPVPYHRDYRVAGVFFTGMYEYDLKFVYVTLDSLQNFLDRGDAVDGIEVRIGSADDTDRFIPTDTRPGLLREALGPGYRIVDWRELNRSLFSALKLEKIAMFLVLGIVILVASFSIIGNLVMVVVEKAKEIALLKTLGASDFGITQMFAIQGLLIGIVGTLIGVVTGLLACWAASEFGIPLSPEVYYIDKLPIHVDWQSVAAVGAAGVLISLVATLYPAFLASRIRPANGLRQ